MLNLMKLTNNYFLYVTKSLIDSLIHKVNKPVINKVLWILNFPSNTQNAKIL